MRFIFKDKTKGQVEPIDVDVIHQLREAVERKQKQENAWREEVSQHFLTRTCIPNIFTPDFRFKGILFYIREESDIEFLCRVYLVDHMDSCDFRRYGPGWYFFYVDDQIPHERHIFHLENIQNRMYGLQRWISNVTDQIQRATAQIEGM